MTRLPRVLGSTMQELRRLHPVEQSVDECMTPLSTASLTLADGESLAMHDWVEVYTDAGSAGIYRARKVSDTYTVESSAELEHGICALGDAIIPGQGTLSGTRKAVLSTMLGYQVLTVGGQPLWQVGSVSNNGSIEYEYDNVNLLSAVLEIVPDGCKLVFDQSALPWTIGIASMETTPSCEGRITRNLRSVTVTMDDEELCTRIYCDKLPEPHYMDGPNIGTWGVKVKTITAQDNVTQESLVAYITQYLEDHKDPRISIEIDADDLAGITGESIDRFEIGRLFRLALPDYGVTMEERILEVRHSSAFGDPEHVQLTLSNSIRDTADTMVRIDNAVTGGASASSAKSGSVGTKGTGLSQTSVLDMLKKTDTYIAENEAWTREAGIRIESNSAEIYATKTSIVGGWDGDVETINALIQASSDNGGLVAMMVGRKNSLEEVNALISATAAGGGFITLKADYTVVEGIEKRVSQAEIDIDGANAAIALKASQESVDGLAKRVSQAEINIDGANAAIALKASQETVDNLTKRVSQAEIDIDGANAQIALKASQESVDGLTKRVSQAEINIDGANAAISLKASQTTVDELGERVSSAEINIDGANSKITLKADKVDLDALITEVNGLKTGGVKATSLYTAQLIVTNSYFHLGTYDAEWMSMDPVTSVSGKATGLIVVRDADGNIAGTALTGYSVSYSTGTINYVGR